MAVGNGFTQLGDLYIREKNSKQLLKAIHDIKETRINYYSEKDSEGKTKLQNLRTSLEDGQMYEVSTILGSLDGIIPKTKFFADREHFKDIMAHIKDMAIYREDIYKDLFGVKSLVFNINKAVLNADFYDAFERHIVIFNHFYEALKNGVTSANADTGEQYQERLYDGDLNPELKHELELLRTKNQNLYPEYESPEVILIVVYSLSKFFLQSNEKKERILKLFNCGIEQRGRVKVLVHIPSRKELAMNKSLKDVRVDDIKAFTGDISKIIGKACFFKSNNDSKSEKFQNFVDNVIHNYKYGEYCDENGIMKLELIDAIDLFTTLFKQLDGYSYLVKGKELQEKYLALYNNAIKHATTDFKRTDRAKEVTLFKYYAVALMDLKNSVTTDLAEVPGVVRRNKIKSLLKAKQLVLDPRTDDPEDSTVDMDGVSADKSLLKVDTNKLFNMILTICTPELPYPVTTDMLIDKTNLDVGIYVSDYVQEQIEAGYEAEYNLYMDLSRVLNALLPYVHSYQGSVKEYEPIIKLLKEGYQLEPVTINDEEEEIKKKVREEVKESGLDSDIIDVEARIIDEAEYFDEPLPQSVTDFVKSEVEQKKTVITTPLLSCKENVTPMTDDSYKEMKDSSVDVNDVTGTSTYSNPSTNNIEDVASETLQIEEYKQFALEDKLHGENIVQGNTLPGVTENGSIVNNGPYANMRALNDNESTVTVTPTNIPESNVNKSEEQKDEGVLKEYSVAGIRLTERIGSNGKDTVIYINTVDLVRLYVGLCSVVEKVHPGYMEGQSKRLGDKVNFYKDPSLWVTKENNEQVWNNHIAQLKRVVAVIGVEDYPMSDGENNLVQFVFAGGAFIDTSSVSVEANTQKKKEDTVNQRDDSDMFEPVKTSKTTDWLNQILNHLNVDLYAKYKDNIRCKGDVDIIVNLYYSIEPVIKYEGTDVEYSKYYGISRREYVKCLCKDVAPTLSVLREEYIQLLNDFSIFGE